MNYEDEEMNIEEISLSQIIYGAWRWDACEPFQIAWGREIIDTCLESEITTFDHADIYGDFRCEEYFGRVLRESPGLRDQIEIISKFGIQFPSSRRPGVNNKHYNTSSEHIRLSVENSLKNFGTDYIDLLLIHRPDPRMDFEDTANGLESVVKSGKVRAVGVSNFLPWQFDTLSEFLNIPLVTNQVEFSVLHHDPMHDGTIAQSQLYGFPITAWSPLGGGSLFNGTDDKSVRLRQCLEEIGEPKGFNIAQTALSWILEHPAAILPVIGSNKIDRIKEYAAAQNMVWELQDWYKVVEAATGEEIP
tara:strand:- start:1779 stop:2690 length:912 start_codon:yes stop_codon:yes gene_type:complete